MYLSEAAGAFRALRHPRLPAANAAMTSRRLKYRSGGVISEGRGCWREGTSHAGETSESCVVRSGGF